MKKKNIKILLFIAISFCIFFTVIKYNEVSINVTKEDIVFTQKILKIDDLKSLVYTNIEEELTIIKLIQTSVLQIAPINKGIPHNQNREPKNLYEYRKGLCYDRSRVIEKMLNTIGFETRHISIFKEDSLSIIPSFVRSGTPSHAISEVLTSKGWMFIDSNDKFLGLTLSNEIVSITALSEKGFNSIDWNIYNNKNYRVLYQNDFTFIYGLYSRHGHFYPPYNFIPDINLKEFSTNF